MKNDSGVNLLHSILDPQLPEPHVVALLDQALLHLVAHLGKHFTVKEDETGG